jgi:hypothetical protein
MARWIRVNMPVIRVSAVAVGDDGAAGVIGESRCRPCSPRLSCLRRARLVLLVSVIAADSNRATRIAVPSLATPAVVPKKPSAPARDWDIHRSS